MYPVEEMKTKLWKSMILILFLLMKTYALLFWILQHGFSLGIVKQLYIKNVETHELT